MTRAVWLGPLIALLWACGGGQTTTTDGDETGAAVAGENSEAPPRPQPAPWHVDFEHYDISVRLDPDTLQFSGIVVARGRAREGLTSITLHAGEELFVGEIAVGELGPDTLDYTRDGDLLHIALDAPLDAGDEIVLRMAFAGEAGDRDHYGLFHTRSASSDRPWFFTQFEAMGARLAFPLYDEPFDRASTTMHLMAPLGYNLLSNGALQGCASTTDGWQTCTWHNPDPIPTYLITLVVAELEMRDATYTRGDGVEIPLTVYAEPGRYAQTGDAMASLQHSLSFFERTFGMPYPWDRYGIVPLPGFRYGGMENKGLTNINAAYVHHDPRVDGRAHIRPVYGIVAHELAHEWFGNLVTMSWWDDIWLNEGFASFMAREASRDRFDRDWADLGDAIGLRRWYMDVERGPFAHPVVYDGWTSTEELFDAISYTKGRKIVEMLQTLMGPPAFREALAEYFDTHGLGNAATEDFFAVMQSHCPLDLTPFLDGWIHTAGFPVVTLEHRWVPERSALEIDVRQESAQGGPGQWMFPLELTAQVDGAARTMRFVIDQTEQTVVISDLAGEPELLLVNPANLALIDYEVVGRDAAEWTRVASEARHPYHRGYALLRAIEAQPEAVREGEAPLPRALIEAWQSALTDASPAVRNVAAGFVTDAEWPGAFRTAAAAALIDPLSLLAGVPVDDVVDVDPLPAIDARLSAVAALGWVGDEAAIEALTGLLSTGQHVDLRRAAVGSLLRTDAPHRYDAHDALLREHLDHRPWVQGMVQMLAGVPDAQVLDRLRTLLADPAIIDPLDHQLVRGVMGTLISTNADLAYSEAGMAFLLDLFTAEIDRPGTIRRTVRRFQAAAERDPDEQARLAEMLSTLRARIVEADGDTGAIETIDRMLDSLDATEAGEEG